MCARRLSLTCAHEGSSTDTRPDVGGQARPSESTQLGQLPSPEISRVLRRMRNDEIGSCRGLPVISDDVEVEGSRSPTHVARPTGLALDSLQFREQLPRRQLGLERDHLIEIGPLLNRADGRRLLDRRRGDHSRPGMVGDGFSCPREMLVAVAEIGAERDVRNVAQTLQRFARRGCA